MIIHLALFLMLMHKLLTQNQRFCLSTFKSYSDSVDFYKDAIKEMDIDFEGESEESYVAWGSIDDYSFTISISNQSATKTIIMLDVSKR